MLNMINPLLLSTTLIPLVFLWHECAKINGAQNSLFFLHLGARKLMVCEFLKYDFRSEFDGILQYFSPP